MQGNSLEDKRKVECIVLQENYLKRELTITKQQQKLIEKNAGKWRKKKKRLKVKNRNLMLSECLFFINFNWMTSILSRAKLSSFRSTLASLSHPCGTFLSIIFSSFKFGRQLKFSFSNTKLNYPPQYSVRAFWYVENNLIL